MSGRYNHIRKGKKKWSFAKTELGTNVSNIGRRLKNEKQALFNHRLKSL